MRAAAAVLLCASAAFAQFRSTVPLVVAPTTITDGKGRYVDGLTPGDLILYDNNVPQPIQMDWMEYPISLVVVVQASSNSKAILDKLAGSGILFTELLAADRGETALITFSDEARVHRDFTADPKALKESLEKLRVEGDGACMLDAMREALRLLEGRTPGRRRVILMIAEKRDRSSQVELTDVVREVERQNAAIFWLTYSPFLEPFTVRPKNPDKFVPDAKGKTMTAKERLEQEDKQREQDEADLKRTQPGPGGLLYGLMELAHMKQPDLADLFTRITGARSIGFLQRKGLEDAIQAVGEEVHRQYILSFQPHPGEAGQFHTLHVIVKGRPELQVKTREGYWPAQ
jgi:VWFA-related protein